jgi:hypothetical protein
MGAFVYSAFGLTLTSDRPVPGLLAAAPGPAPPLHVRFGAASELPPSEGAGRLWYPTPEQPASHAGLTVRLLDGGAWFRFRYDDGTEFDVEPAGTEVRARWAAASTFEDTVTYLLGPVLGFVLRLRGRTCLHASAVAVGDRALALVGPAGVGKSTTAAALAGRGCPVLADDVLPLEMRGAVVLAHPAYPRLRLWPESAQLLYGGEGALPPLTPTWDKRYLDLTARDGAFCPRPLPLEAVYLLGERGNGPGAPAVRALSGPTGLLALVRNTYVNYLLDRAMRGREFALLGRVAAGVALREAAPHAGAAHLGGLCDLLLEDFAALASGAPPQAGT